MQAPKALGKCSLQLYHKHLYLQAATQILHFHNQIICHILLPFGDGKQRFSPPGRCAMSTPDSGALTKLENLKA